MTHEGSSASTGRYFRNSWESQTLWGTAMRINCCALVLTALLADVSRGQDVTWRNDSLTQGQYGMIQAGFVSGDIGAAVFDVQCTLLPLQIKSVQVFWRSQAGPTTR